MEKIIQLSSKESQESSVIMSELTNAWAQIGVFLEQLEQFRRARDQILEKQKGFVRQTVVDHGISKFENARLVNDTIVLTVEEEFTAVN